MRLKLPKITFWRAVLGTIWALGLFSAFWRFSQGLGAATHLSDQFPWGIWIGFDILVGVGLAAGGFVITATVYIFNLKQFKPIARPTLLTAYLGYLLVIGALLFDLGLPLHVWHPIIYWNPHSVMFEVGWCVILYTIILTLEFLPLVFEKFSLYKPLKILQKLVVVFVFAGVLLSTLHQSSLGTLYVIVPDKLHPLWYTGLLPLLFFISAVAGGLAMVIFESYTSARAFGKQLELDILEKLGRVIVVVLALYLVIRIQLLVANHALGYIFDGSTESLMFIAEILVGALIPIVLLMINRVRYNTAGLFLAAVFVLIGFIMNRLNVSITGMARSAGVNYFPSWMEIAITLSIVSLGFVIFRLAAKHLPLYGNEKPSDCRHPAPLIAAGADGRRVVFVLGILLLLNIVAIIFSFPDRKAISSEAASADAEKLPVNLESDLSLPKPILFEMGEDSPGAVTFDHQTHVNTDEPNCIVCHQAMFKLHPPKAGAKGAVQMDLLYEGKQCGSCHNGTDAFDVDDGCEFCHRTP